MASKTRKELNLRIASRDEELRMLFGEIRSLLLESLKDRNRIKIIVLPHDWVVDYLTTEDIDAFDPPHFEDKMLQIVRDIREIRTLLAQKRVKVIFRRTNRLNFPTQMIQYSVFRLKQLSFPMETPKSMCLGEFYRSFPENAGKTEYRGLYNGAPVLGV